MTPVWFDRNGDGLRDPSDDGIPGVTVTLTWFGGDGVAGGGDDATFTRTTGASGDYLFDHLPAGAYRVVSSGLPVDYVNTFDEDGNEDQATPGDAAGRDRPTSLPTSATAAPTRDR